MIGVLFEIVFMAMALAQRMQFKKEQALFNATHEPETLLANSNLLEAKMQSLIRLDNTFAVCIIEITDFSTLLPYISNTDNNDITMMVAQAIERKLCHEENFYELENNKYKTTKLAKINEGVFAVLVQLTSKASKEKVRLTQQLAFLQQDMAKGAQIGKLFVNLSTSVGLSLLEQQKDSQAQDIIKQAYQALEQGKRETLGIGIYQPEEALNVAQRLALASDLQQALRNNELELYHQPQINIDDNSVDGSEVLLRWKHSGYGFIAPDVFIKLAEDTGIINELTLWVVAKACEDLEKIIKLGYNDYNVSVNISGKDISGNDFLDNIKNVVNKYDIPLSNLTFELTESVMVTDLHHLSQVMNELSLMGIQLAIDDYGTGYSSLLYISQLPFNEIKIDKTFVMNLAESKRDLTIVRTTIEMAKSLGLKIVAEGIENEAVEAILKKHECHIVQGYYYQKPSSFKKHLAWLEKFLANR
jgi:EAL domain-containing protein (putative c-di-GMP-specific phosphodiesterase class I)/GGDEF domain-containing protein